MGEAKRRGTHMDRIQQAKDAIELECIMAKKRKVEAEQERQRAFEALPEEEQARILEEERLRDQKRRKYRALLISALAASACR